jgi:hypothetical protein
MANSWIEPPPPQRGMGCFGKGCLILSVFIFVLIAAGCVGLYWGFRHHSAFVRGAYWVWTTKTNVLANSPKEIPASQATDTEIQTVQERWRIFEDSVNANEPAEIELTGDDINDLIAASRKWRGKLFVSIEGNRFRLQTSIPLREYVPQYGYYFNADITADFDTAQSIDRPRLSAIAINGKPVPADLLDWEYDSRPLRSYFVRYQNEYSGGTVEMRDGKVILRSRAN